MRSRVALVATLAAVLGVAALTACRDSAAPTAPAAAGSLRFDRGGQGGAPAPVHQDPVLDPNFTVTCGFPVLFGYDGRVKELQLPGGRVIFPDPAFTSTLVNGLTGVTVTFSTTGVLHLNPLPSGGTEYVTTGNNVVGLRGTELFLFSGRSTVVVDAQGNLVQDWEGVGHRTDLCPLLAG